MTAAELELLTPGEVAAQYRVDPKTVSRWAKDGKFDGEFEGTTYKAVRTPGGHIRIPEIAVRAWFAQQGL